MNVCVRPWNGNTTLCFDATGRKLISDRKASCNKYKRTVSHTKKSYFIEQTALNVNVIDKKVGCMTDTFGTKSCDCTEKTDTFIFYKNSAAKREQTQEKEQREK